jgi:hypothetical protein
MRSEYAPDPLPKILSLYFREVVAKSWNPRSHAAPAAPLPFRHASKQLAQLPVIVYRNVQVGAGDAHVGMARGVADLGQRAAADAKRLLRSIAILPGFRPAERPVYQFGPRMGEMGPSSLALVANAR